MSSAPVLKKSTVDAAFEFFRTELKRRVGINISENKSEMMSGRLRKRLIELKLHDFDDYAEYLKSLPSAHEEWETFVNCLTTNKTDFFREPEHFEYLTTEIIPEWRKQNKSEFNVWCAAASTGEEPYTLSMVLHRQAKLKHFDYSIVATDIDSDVLEKAQHGVYSKSKLHEIPLDYQREAIAVGTGDIDRWMKIKNPLREALSFERCNLVKSPYSHSKKYDVVFCRNVLIYFTPETIQGVAKGIYDVTKPGGYLIIGHSESLHNVDSPWQYIKPSVYRKKA
ncbi:MAG: protein-glutamate O-methyltransferase CheR [Proteobacteria bacterium]|nr:MAG: protein-glutamate O-methyltransferase CheR [Pseudomonadota bacterium]